MRTINNLNSFRAYCGYNAHKRIGSILVHKQTGIQAVVTGVNDSKKTVTLVLPNKERFILTVEVLLSIYCSKEQYQIHQLINRFKSI